MIGDHKRILLVDDDQQVLFVLQASLERIGMPCVVIASYDGSKAYRLLQTDIFDLLITAIRMPRIDGIALTALARSVSRTLPVVWITAHGCTALHEDAIRLGVYRCLEKPVEISEFRKVVQQALVEVPSTDAFIPDG